MNVVDGIIENGTLKIGGITVPTNTTASGKVTVGIRPEHIIADTNGPLSITVKMGEPLGANTLLHGRIGDSTDAFTISLPGVHHAVSGEQISFSVAPNNLHFFDPATGARIA